MDKPHFKRVPLSEVKDGQFLWRPALRKSPDPQLPRLYRPGEPMKYERVGENMADSSKVFVRAYGSVRLPGPRRIVQWPADAKVWVEV